MNLNQLSIIARQRSTWEAIDLGILVARKWYLPLFLGWAIPSCICFIFLCLVFPGSLWISITVTWWLKPVWDRIPLYIASRALFGESLSLSDTLKSSPHFLFSDAFAWLTWRRLSPTRSFDMPVTLLEGLKGKRRLNRLQILHIKSSGSATLLTLVCVHIELILMIGIISMAMWLIPQEVEFSITDFMRSSSFNADLLGYVLSYISMIIVAPFYTVAGFILYISRRIDLEGWDIEIRFRHIANRHQEQSSNNNPRRHVVASLFLIFFIPLFQLLATPFSYAAQEANQPTSSTQSPAATARSDIKKILQNDDFGHEIVNRNWRFKDSEDLAKDDEIPNWFIRMVEFLEDYFDDDDEIVAEKNTSWWKIITAQGFELILWFVAIAILLAILYHYRQQIRTIPINLGIQKKPPPAATEVLFGLDVRKESLPKDIPEQVNSLWQQNAYREALGLLYRATLSGLIHQYQFSFSDSNTESECADIVRNSAAEDVSKFVTALTGHWQQLAYGHRVPQGLDVNQLCQNWQAFFADKKAQPNVIDNQQS